MDGNANQEGENMYQPEEVITPGKKAADPQTPTERPDRVSNEAASTAPIAAPQAVETADPDAIRWTASEFVAHSKSTTWYVLLGLAAALLAGIIWFLTRDMFATATVVVGVVLLGIYAGRQPREESYTLDNQGITIGSRHYMFSEFRSFSVIPEGAFMSIELTPFKRLAMYTTIYCAPNDEDKIVALLSAHLPIEEAHPSLTDSLMRRIHF